MKLHGEVTFRLAVGADIEAVVLLDRELDTLPHWPVGEYRAAVEGGDPQRMRCLFVAELVSGGGGGEIVGLAVGRVDHIAGECSGELESVGVAASAQRTGIGRELCRSVIGWCESQGATELDLEVRSQSAGAISLYGELGFVMIGRRPGYYRDPADDALLMRLDLKRERSEPSAVNQPAP
jgi:[ribosomal protein S18]-alanine N-acetyltransferase